MKKLIFPKSFRFGVADADLQVIGETYTLKEEGSAQTMWDETARTKNFAFDHTPPGKGIDRYHRWKEDIEIMKKMGIKDYRTSVSMSRTLKENGDVNEKAIEWYRAFFKALRAEGITLYTTLYHWELPQYLNAIGGWTNKKSVETLVKHAEVVHEHLGEYIEEYFILNEPWCSSLLSYYLGIHAPGEKNLSHALLASHNLLLAQGQIERMLHQKDKSLKVSTVLNTEAYYAHTASDKDIFAAKCADGNFNRWFMDPIYLGKYPEDMLELYGKHAPKFTAEEMRTINIGKNLYSLGINNYLGRVVEYDKNSDLKFKQVILPGSITNDLGWVISVPPLYPETLYDSLSQIYYSYKYFGLKRLYITENGTALNTPWDGKSHRIKDKKRIFYLKEHIRQIHRAVMRGIPVEAYLEWSLIDNYEWAEGYRPESCFGLIHADRDTMKRVWKDSAHWYAGVVKSNSIEI